MTLASPIPSQRASMLRHRSACERMALMACFAILIVYLLAFVKPALGQMSFSAPHSDVDNDPIVMQTLPVSELPRFLTNERPLRRQIFEDFLKARKSINDADLQMPALIQVPRAFYNARFSPHGKLEGTARIEFASRSGKAVILPTPDLQMAIREMKWKGREDPVLWGVAPDLRLVLVVPTSGELEFEWTSPSVKGSSHQSEFDLALLRAVRTEFVLSAPHGWMATSEGIPPVATIGDDADWLSNTFQLGSASRVRFQLENTLSPAANSSGYWVNMNSRYDIGRQGIDLVADLEIEITDLPLAKLPFQIDESLQLVAAKMGDQSIAWSPRQGGKEHAVELRFDPPLMDSGRKVRLEARATLPNDQMASLPRIRLADKGLRESELELNIAPPLELVGIELHGARFVDSGTVVSPRGGESRRIRLNSPAADIRCAFREPEFRGKVRYAARVAVNEAAWELEALFRLKIESGERFDLSTFIPSGWVVDNVESDPAGAIESWLVGAEQSQQKLSLRLQRALTPKAPISFRVTAHMPRVSNDAISSTHFLFANFEALSLESGFLQLLASQGFRVEADGDPARLNPAVMDPSDLEMITLDSAGTLYRLLPKRPFSIAHSVSGAEFRVTTASRVLLGQERVNYEYRVGVTPTRHQLDRLLIRIAPSTRDEVYFSLENNEAQGISATLVEAEPAGDLWELRFSEPLNREFTVTVVEAAKTAATTRLRTLRCEDAASQDSTVRIYGRNQREWEISASGLQPLLSRMDSMSPLVELASYRYGPTNNPRIEITRKVAAQDSHSLWAWIEDRVTLAGDAAEAFHESSLQFENLTSTEARFLLRPESRLVDVRLNRESISTFRLTGATLQVSIPASRVAQVLQIRVASKNHSRALGISPVTWQGATPDFPVLSTSWSIWTPPDVVVGSIFPKPNLRGCVALFDRGTTASPTEPKALLAKPNFNSTAVRPDEALTFDEDHLRAAGWTLAKFAAPTTFPSQVICYSESSWRFAGWCATITSLVLVFSLLSYRSRYQGVALAAILLCMALSLFAPSPTFFLSSGGLLGSVLGLLLWSVSIAAKSLPRIAPTQSGVSIGIMVGGILIWQSTSGPFAFGQPLQQPPNKSDSQKSRNVIDPVDTDGKPAGDFIYISPELFEDVAIMRPAQTGDPCILQEVRYRISRPSIPPTQSIAVAAEYIYVASADSQIVPLLVDTNTTPLAQDEVFVDGERRLIRGGEGRLPQIELVGRGLHTIRMNLRLPMLAASGPPLAAWRTLRLPKQSLEIETDSALIWSIDGADVMHDPVSRTAKIPLSPNRELKLGFRKVATTTAVAESAIQHDAWITIDQGSVAFEHLVRVGPESSANSIVFELGDSISLDSIMGNNRRIITPISLGDRLYQAPLDSTADEDAEIRILCSMKSGLGFSRVTSTGVVFPGAKSPTTRIGVSALPELELQAEVRPGVSDLPVTEFVQSWPPGRTPPRMAISVEPRKSWSIDVRPLVPQSSVATRTEFLLRPTEMQIEWDAEVTSGGEPASLYVLGTPPALRIESVSVSEASANRLLRFARTSPERITLFMRTSSLEPRRIRLRGAIPLAPEGSALLPTLTLENAAVTSQFLKVFRGDETQVEITQIKGLRAVDSSAAGEAPVISVLQSEQSRLVGEFEVIAPSQPWEARLTVAPNAPQLSHESVARFETRDSKWRLEQLVKLKILSGVVDELDFELPGGLREPIQISPNESFRIVREKDGPAHLLIRTSQPWKETRVLRISGEYSQENAAVELALSPLRLLKSTLEAGWIAAPKQTGGSGFNWKGEGSDEAAPPAGEAMAADVQWFKQRDANATVQLRRGAAASQSANARLDGRVMLDGQRFTAVLTWFWGGATQEATLVAPEGVQVLRARVIGSSTPISQVSPTKWRMSSALGSAPPALEVVCMASFSPGESLLLPTLEGASIQESLITVSCARQFAPAHGVRDFIISKNAGFESRLRLLDQIKRDAQTTLPTLGEQESLTWRRCWLEHWDAARSMVTFEPNSKEVFNPTIPKWLQDADVERARIRADIEAGAAEPSPSETDSADSALSATVMSEFANLDQSIHFFAEGKPLTVELEPRSALSLASESIQDTLEASPWLLPAFAVGLLCLVLLATNASRRAMSLRVAPALGWIGLGVAWWLWLTPVWFGPLISSAAVLFMLVAMAKQWSRQSFGRSPS